MVKDAKIRVNISVDKKLLDEAKKKLNLFGGKLSTLFNAYLEEFVKSMNQTTNEKREEIDKRLKNIEKRLAALEK